MCFLKNVIDGSQHFTAGNIPIAKLGQSFCSGNGRMDQFDRCMYGASVLVSLAVYCS